MSAILEASINEATAHISSTLPKAIMWLYISWQTDGQKYRRRKHSSDFVCNDFLVVAYMILWSCLTLHDSAWHCLVLLSLQLMGKISFVGSGSRLVVVCRRLGCGLFDLAQGHPPLTLACSCVPWMWFALCYRLWLSRWSWFIAQVDD